MTRFLATTCAAVCVATGVSAGDFSKTADLTEAPVAVPAPMPVAAPRFDWTGAYAGAALGYGNMDIRGTDSGSAVAGGLFAGYRWDFGNFVAGGEAVIAPAPFGSPRFANGDRIRGGASLLLSVGMPVTQDARTLGYVAAGPSMLRTRGDDGSEISTGATVAVGVDHMLTDDIMLRGSVNYTAINNVGGADYRTRTTGASVGLGFKF